MTWLLGLLGAALAVFIAGTAGVAVGRARCGHFPIELPGSLVYDLTVVDEPWRLTHPHALRLPVALLAAYANPQKLAEQRFRDGAWIAELTDKLAAEGQLEPMELTVDGRGRAVLSDGYHRLPGLVHRAVPYAGVIIKTSPGIKGWGRQLGDLFTNPELARHMQQVAN